MIFFVLFLVLLADL